MARYAIPFEEIGRGDLPRVGGKGLNLGELTRVEGLRVPAGFCVSTDAYRKMIRAIPELDELLDRLSEWKTKDLIDGGRLVAETAGRIRALSENAPMPDDVADDIARALAELGDGPYAVRSSATAEDLGGASFAGQQDTFLNVRGLDAVLEHVKKCQASLFTDRAVIYRTQNGFDHRRVALSAVVQRMIFPQASGIMFTADPVSGNRKTVSIDAGFGLGEALVSGIVSADNYRVRDGAIVGRTVSRKKIFIVPVASGGTEEQPVPAEKQNTPALSDEQILELASLGRAIETHYAAKAREEAPQDIEWALADGAFYVLQSRPITTLYPIPDFTDDGRLHLFVCVNHMQMMTEPIRPLGLAFFRSLAEAWAEIPVAGGRLFMDVSRDMQSPISRWLLLYSFAETDVLIRNIIRDIPKERKDIVKRLSRHGQGWLTAFQWEFAAWLWQAFWVYRSGDLGGVDRAVAYFQGTLEDTRNRFEGLSGEALLDMLDREMATVVDTWMKSSEMGYLLMMWIFSHGWLRRNLKTWLGPEEEHAVDILSKSVPHNPTSEMGLALLDIAHLVRRRPAVCEALRRARDDHFLADVEQAEGGREVAAALADFLDKYGMRCSGEIDITRARWYERPTALVPMILNNAENPDLTSGAERFEQGRIEAEKKERELLARLEKLPGGKRKAERTRKMIAFWRGVSGFREYPKYFTVQAFRIYKKALMREADELTRRGVFRDREDIYYLTFAELREAVRTGKTDAAAIARRREDYARFEKMAPPRVMTSEGEILRGSYGGSGPQKAPEGALIGMPVSSGVIEGTARVVLRQRDAAIQPGDILVTAFTDPSWTPLFVAVKGLVTEVGGQMTHGAVITREYGIPAVVGVEDATKRIPNGKKIRVNGTEGWVEILE